MSLHHDLRVFGGLASAEQYRPPEDRIVVK